MGEVRLDGHGESLSCGADVSIYMHGVVFW